MGGRCTPPPSLCCHFLPFNKFKKGGFPHEKKPLRSLLFWVGKTAHASEGEHPAFWNYELFMHLRIYNVIFKDNFKHEIGLT